MAKYGLMAELGQRTSKGTLITERIQSAAKADIEGLEIIADNTEQVLAEMDSALGRALEEIGLVAEGYAKRLAPIDTGRLRNSITHTIDPSDKTAVIGTNVEYALFVHEGVHGRPGVPFLRDAASDHADQYRGILEKHLRGA